MRTVSVIVTTHQGRKFLGPCLRALLKTELPDDWLLEPIVVDNGSSDGTEQYVRSEFPRVRSLVFAEALGFARANNAARSVSTGEVVVFLNNDTAVDPGWLRRPLELFDADPKVAVVGSRLLYLHRFRRCRIVGRPGARVAIGSRVFGNELDHKVRWSSGVSQLISSSSGGARWVPVGESFFIPDPLEGLDATPPREAVVSFLGAEGDTRNLDAECMGESFGLSKRFPQARRVPSVGERVELIQAAGGELTRTGEGGDFGSGKTGDELPLSEMTVPTLCGAAFIARRSALDGVGWFPDDYFVYYEDTHLATMIRAKGGLLVFCPSSVVRHYHTGTNKENSPFFVENVARSRLTFIAHFGGPKVLARQFAEQLGWSVREVLASSDLTVPQMWKGSHGLRGMVRSVPAVVRASIGRLLRGEFAERCSLLNRLPVDRSLYSPPSSEKGFA